MRGVLGEPAHLSACRAVKPRKNGGVTFPRQAAKRAKANRERNGSVGQRWKLWKRTPKDYLSRRHGARSSQQQTFNYEKRETRESV